MVLAVCLGSGGQSLWAQTLAVPPGMPVIYQEMPDYMLLRQRACHKIVLHECVLKSEGVQNGYYLERGLQKFVILNQNPACLRGFVGRTVAVAGRTTESVVPWFRLFFIEVDAINGLHYAGNVAPWVMREPTDQEVSYWKLHRRLPPQTERCMARLAIPRGATWASWNGPAAPLGISPGTETEEVAAAQPQAQGIPTVDLDQRLRDMQGQLRAIQGQLNRRPYDGIYSTPSNQWNATDWGIYVSSHGGA